LTGEFSKTVLHLTEQLYQAKKFVTVLSFANSVFSLYAIIESFLARSYFLVLVAAMIFFFNCLFFAYGSSNWSKK
jgi:hypothetical protein